MNAKQKTAREVSKAFYFESDSNPNRPPYETLMYVDGSLSCNCPGWTFKGKTLSNGERTCKHTRLIMVGFGDRAAKKVVSFRPVSVSHGFEKVVAARNSVPDTGEELTQKRRRMFNL